MLCNINIFSEAFVLGDIPLCSFDVMKVSKLEFCKFSFVFIRCVRLCANMRAVFFYMRTRVRV